MITLLDENLSHKLAPLLADLFGKMSHVRDIGLQGAPDLNICQAAKEAGFQLLITTDRDFLAIVAENGPPPKVLRIEGADITTKQMAALLRKHAIQIHELLTGKRAALTIRAH